MESSRELLPMNLVCHPARFKQISNGAHGRQLRPMSVWAAEIESVEASAPYLTARAVPRGVRAVYPAHCCGESRSSRPIHPTKQGGQPCWLKDRHGRRCLHGPAST